MLLNKLIIVTSTDTLGEIIKGVVKGRELPFPEARKDPCNNGNLTPACPIRAGQKYQFKAKFQVKPFYPTVINIWICIDL